MQISQQTVSAIQSVVLALCRNPGVLKKAQDELDQVVGNSRLPTFEDRPLLPYIEGIVREANRFIFYYFTRTLYISICIWKVESSNTYRQAFPSIMTLLLSTFQKV